MASHGPKGKAVRFRRNGVARTAATQAIRNAHHATGRLTAAVAAPMIGMYLPSPQPKPPGRIGSRIQKTTNATAPPTEDWMAMLRSPVMRAAAPTPIATRTPWTARRRLGSRRTSRSIADNHGPSQASGSVGRSSGQRSTPKRHARSPLAAAVARGIHQRNPGWGWSTSSSRR